MADPETTTPVDAGSPASTAEPSSAPSSASELGSSTDSRAIAASLLSGDTEGAAAESRPAESESPSQPADAINGDENDPEYLKLLASGASISVPRHKAVLTNTRNKTRQQVEQEYRAKYGWAENFDRQRAEHGLGLLSVLEGPNREQAFRTLAHAMGINLAPPPPSEPEGPPPPDVRLDNGEEFFTAKAWMQREQWLQQQFDRKLADVTKRYDPLIQRQALSDMRQQAHTEAGTLLESCRKEWPQFSALEGDIKQRMAANPQLSLEHAYIQAFAQKGLPALEAQHQTDRASQLSRKAAASAAPPSAPRAVTPVRDRDRSTADIAREVAAAAGL